MLRPDRILGRLYRAVVLLYPPSVRERDGADMVRLFDDMVEGARRTGGPVAATVTALRIFVEAPLSASRAHWRVWGRSVVEAAFMDFGVALRVLRTKPHFTLAAVLTLTVGIGGTTAMFSVLRGSFLRPPPFPEVERLAVLHLTAASGGEDPARVRWSYPEYERLVAGADFAEGVASFVRAGLNLTGDAGAVRVEGEVVSPGYFDILGVGPVLGRGFGGVAPGPDPAAGHTDQAAGTAPARASGRTVVIGHGLWQRRWGGDPGVLGREVRVNRVPLTVVGVMPPGFSGLSGRAEMWVPHAAAPDVYYARFFDDHEHFLTAVARRARGVDPAVARERTAALAGGIAAEVGHDDGRRWSGTARPLSEARVDPATRRSHLLLFGAVALVLVIGCINLANILLARTASRRRELATRMAMGSSTGRLVRQLLVEGVALALVGGLLGVVAAWLGTDLLAGLVTDAHPAGSGAPGQLGPLADVRVDLAVLLFAGGLSVATGLVLAVLPALWASRTEPGEVLHQAGSTGSPTLGRSVLTPSSLLVVGEFAVALVLLTGAGLLGTSYLHVQGRDLGLDPDGVVTFRLRPSWAAYQDREASEFLRRVLESVRSVPGVSAASVGPCTPMANCATRRLFTEGRPEAAPLVRRHYVGPEHFEVLGVRVVRGRGITRSDGPGATRVTVVGRAAAERFWPDADPLGQRVWFDEEHVGVTDSAFHVVGVVEDVRYDPPGEDQGADFYTSYLQFGRADTRVMIRTGRDLGGLVSDVGEAVAAVDPAVPVGDLEPLSVQLREPLQRSRSTSTLLLAFAGVGVVLAALGVYGVMTQLVVRRRKEMGIRMALGSGRGGVVGLVLKQASLLVGAGLVTGLVISLLGARLLRSFLYGVQPADPAVVGGAAGVLLLVAFLASWLPARAAGRVEPVQVLNAEG